MSLGLRLRARLSSPVRSPAGFIREVEEWLNSNYAEMLPKSRKGEVDGHPAMFCQLHPAAEEIEFALTEPDRIVASANTTTAGPGYHIFVTSLLRAWSDDFKASWEVPESDSEEFGDETGFFFDGDEDGLRAEMLWWLQSLAKTFFDGSVGSDLNAVHLCLPFDPQFESDQAAVTAMGPRTLEWLLETSRDGTRGKDFFAWWSRGVGVDYYLGRALSQMWCDVRWRRPANKSELRTLRDTADCLRHAHQIDDSLAYPWAEWSQILSFLEADSTERKVLASKQFGEPVIGYRRANVSATLPGGWNLTIPGSFSDFESDEEDAVCALDPPREIWFTAFQVAKERTEGELKTILNRIRTTETELLIERGGYVSRATVQEKQNSAHGNYFILSASNHAPRSRSVCTIIFHEETQREWAIETWKSLKPPGI